jgi:hypothetical protein
MKIFCLLAMLLTSVLSFGFDLLGGTPAYIKNHPLGKSTQEGMQYAGVKDPSLWNTTKCGAEIDQACSAKSMKCSCLNVTLSDRIFPKLMHTVYLASANGVVVDYVVTFYFADYGFYPDTLPRVDTEFGDATPKKITQGQPARNVVPVNYYWESNGVHSFATALCRQQRSAGAVQVKGPVRTCGFRQVAISQIRSAAVTGTPSDLTY